MVGCPYDWALSVDDRTASAKGTYGFGSVLYTLKKLYSFRVICIKKRIKIDRNILEKFRPFYLIYMKSIEKVKKYLSSFWIFTLFKNLLLSNDKKRAGISENYFSHFLPPGLSIYPGCVLTHSVAWFGQILLPLQFFFVNSTVL